MKLRVRSDWLAVLSPKWKETTRYSSQDKWQEASVADFTDGELDKLLATIEPHQDVKGVVAIKQKIKLYRSLKTDTSTKITKLEAVPLALRKLLEDLPHHWLFSGDDQDKHLVPWFVYSAEYTPPSVQNAAPARVLIQLAATRHDTTITSTICYGADDIYHSIVEMLYKSGYAAESKGLLEAYGQELAWYSEICHKTGEQFSAVGLGTDLSDHWNREKVSLVKDEQPTKVVMDNDDDEGLPNHHNTRSQQVTDRMWRNSKEGEEDTENTVMLPQQPYLKVFDLDNHRFLSVYATELSYYTWDEKLPQKLVLPTEFKALIQVLVTGADQVLDDIIKGKTGGIIVICTGPPGTGKTLTAEVFSEGVKKPLYKVQCSQLGTDEVRLEENLKVVMARAERWKAVLLTDEADVYIHKRGRDIKQNAIVGTWLRVLEYYRGILFLTSNRSIVIDDAILSRATAWIRYTIPTPENLRHIWQVLSAQFKVKLSKDDIDSLVTDPKFAKISGRSVKSLLKLSYLLAASSKKAVTAEDIRYVSQFLDIDAHDHEIESTAQD